MLKYHLLLFVFAYLAFINTVAAGRQHLSKYAGQEQRTIKSLSDSDIQQLNQGKGWGLAKAAELNGVPGPSHILQMQNEISLTDAQTAKIQALFDDMRSKAIPLGKELIKLEENLNQAFANRSINNEQLKQKLDAIAQVRSKLRYVHLATHLVSPTILTAKQITLYNQLRGYNSADPCKTTPKGHDINMWKQHNNCQ